MGSSSVLALPLPSFQFAPSQENPLTSKTKKTLLSLVSSRDSSLSYSSSSLLHKSLPLAASALILLSSNPEENQKKYAENDARFKSSPLLNKLLEKSKLNKEKNKLEIQDKYCLRGAEWGVGDCSAEGMTAEEKDNFISMLKQKTGVKQ
ncbi:uncharacterized protein LOC133822898 isoform X2 [Humulus lupulus]|uniref:uncharacterized protein LOC133822898 isoform X2 n=1 Tax=Humulus lupulus TaxID=3486 RepID=UPI002B40BB91|nr:uncharacterized protein LOC133822898 isoform X2 [Humulus lupulus]